MVYQRRATRFLYLTSTGMFACGTPGSEWHASQCLPKIIRLRLEASFDRQGLDVGPATELLLHEFPFQQTVIHFCNISGHKYLIFADRYTCWVEAALMREPNARKVYDCLRAWYCTYGAPEEQASDAISGDGVHPVPAKLGHQAMSFFGSLCPK